MTMNSDLILGYDYDKWYGYGIKEPVITDISTKTNSHTLICGMSGSGKSYAESILLARIANTEGKVLFSDFKQDDSFTFLRECPRYYPYDKTIEALETVYDTLHKRQSGEDTSRSPITLVWDEYMANILAIQGTEKKKADDIMRKVSEILMLGRSLGVRLLISCQRPDAAAFPSGSRLNYGVILIVGAPIRSIYEMLIPKEYIDEIGDRNFKRGEGVALLQGSEMRFIKIPMVRDMEKMQQICIDALVFNVEPESFESFFDAVYWATVSLTTVGYGDIYPISTIGRVITMLSSIFGIAIVALPAGIITAGYMSELENSKKKKDDK